VPELAHAIPTIRPVNHVVDDETIIIRSHLGAVIVAHASTEDGLVVCYEADELDPVRHTGWSVIATGLARLVRDPAAISRYQQMLEPWVEGQMDFNHHQAPDHHGDPPGRLVPLTTSRTAAKGLPAQLSLRRPAGHRAAQPGPTAPR
jgi:hypothetical protein